MTREKIPMDFETHPIKPDSLFPRPVCVSSYRNGKGELYVGDEMRQKVKEWLESDALLIAQNALYECLVIYFNYPEMRDLLIKALEENRIYCTQIYEQLKNNVETSKEACHDKSLAGLVKHYMKLDISAGKKGEDIWRLKYDELDCVPIEGSVSLEEINKQREALGFPKTKYTSWPKEAIDYAISDSKYALEVYVRQQRKNPYLQYGQHLRASVALNYMTDRGILADTARIEVLCRELDEILNPLYQKLYDIGYVKKNKAGKFVKDTIKLREHIDNNFKIKIKTKSGATSLEKQSLQTYLKEKHCPILEDFVGIGRFEKAKTAFAHRLAKADPNNPVVRTQYNPIVSTGRTSSKTSRLIPCSVNMQQQIGSLKGVTYDIRGCMKARPGYKLVCIDYNNLELLATAHQLYKLYGKSRMRDMINMGDVPTDLHSVFACELMSSATGKSIDYDAYLPHKKEEGYKEYRKKGKPVTLGCPGGMGYKTIRMQFAKDGISLPYKEVQKFDAEWKAHAVVRDFRREYPDLRVERTDIREWTVVRDEVVLLRKMLYKTYPELEKFLKEGHKQFLTGKFKWKKNDFGEWEKDELYRYSVFGQSQDNCTYTALCNAWLMQGTSSVGAKESGWQIFKKYHDNPDVHPLAFIHDEYVLEIRDNEDFIKHVDDISEIMIDCQMKYLDSVDVAVEAEIMEYWSKEVNQGSIQYYKKQSDKKLRSWPTDEIVEKYKDQIEELET